jgi:UTP--glucose-1-phosphate uridylyltransferase
MRRAKRDRALHLRTGRKSVIEDHFDRQFELELTPTGANAADLELLSRDLPGARADGFTRQQVPFGLGHGAARGELVGNELFRCSYRTCWCRPNAAASRK